MLEWLFGSKKEEKKPEKPINKEDELSKDEIWIYDYVKQYLTSPIWRNPLLDFMEENCLIFEDVEENKFQYTKVFQEFTGLTALLLESMIDEVGIPEKTLEKCIIRGMRSQKDAKIFGQILICDNFQAFKKHMVAKNKELELQAMKDLNQNTNSKSEAKQIQIDTKELERLELEKAIAMSMAVQGKTQEEKQLQEAIRLSQVEYQKEEQKRVAQKSKVEEKPQPKKTSLLGPLPPLSSVKPPRPIQQYKEQQSKLKEEIVLMKKDEEDRRIKEKEEAQNSEARKKRLLEQRELIRKKKQDERQEDLQNFMQAKNTSASSNLSEEELERRRNLMKRIKLNIKQ